MFSSKEDLLALFNLYSNEGYILAEHQGRFCVSQVASCFSHSYFFCFHLLCLLSIYYLFGFYLYLLLGHDADIFGIEIRKIPERITIWIPSKLV